MFLYVNIGNPPKPAVVHVLFIVFEVVEAILFRRVAPIYKIFDDLLRLRPKIVCKIQESSFRIKLLY